MPEQFEPVAKRRGRPRGFDLDQALDAATAMFWAEGYEAASVDALCRAMNMPRASLYQTFGDKERLFLAAIDHYARTRLAPVTAALGPKRTLAQDLAAFFDQVIALATRNPATAGCLISCVLADAAGANSRLREELRRRFAAQEARIAERLRAAPETVEVPEVTAGLVAAIARGLVVRARSGAGAAVLRPVAQAAVRAVLPHAGA